MNIVKSLEEYRHLAIVREVKTELERRLITVPCPEDSREKDRTCVKLLRVPGDQGVLSAFLLLFSIEET